MLQIFHVFEYIYELNSSGTAFLGVSLTRGGFSCFITVRGGFWSRPICYKPLRLPISHDYKHPSSSKYDLNDVNMSIFLEVTIFQSR